MKIDLETRTTLDSNIKAPLKITWLLQKRLFFLVLLNRQNQGRLDFSWQIQIKIFMFNCIIIYAYHNMYRCKINFKVFSLKRFLMLRLGAVTNNFAAKLSFDFKGITTVVSHACLKRNHRLGRKID